MQTYEYRVVPAPKRAERVKGVRSTQDRFAHALTVMMNDLGRDGWDYQRADTLPCEERVGLTGRTTVFQHMLVFRRALETAGVAAAVPAAAPAPAPIPVFSRPAAVRPVERGLAEHATLAARPLPRKLTADAPEGEAPRISLVQAVPDAVPTLGPATSGATS